jgi:hypothetical protein
MSLEMVKNAPRGIATSHTHTTVEKSVGGESVDVKPTSTSSKTK